MIGKNTILSLMVACGLLLGGSAAYAQDPQVDGECQSLGSTSLRLFQQVVQFGFDFDTCFGPSGILALQTEFMVKGCDFADDTAPGGPITERGKSCNVVSTICDAVFICFGLVIDVCEDVPECTIPLGL